VITISGMVAVAETRPLLLERDGELARLSALLDQAHAGSGGRAPRRRPRARARRIGCRVKQAYGMTEVSGGTHIAPDTGPDRPESVGPALPGVECRIVDPGTGAGLRPGEPGELLVRTAGTMRGYLGQPEATSWCP
jgi:long-subunit acyl-CoA synthetase (AMP-forming)